MKKIDFPNTKCPQWVFEPIGPMGGATGNAFVNVLQAGGIPPEAELAREAIQNSCDAARDGNCRVRVVFRIVILQGSDKSDLLAQLGFDSSVEARFKAVALAPDNCLADPSKPLNLLFIEDYGTIGLSGDPHNRKSHFHRLLLSVGDTEKVSLASSGGSFGYGKSALSMNSRLRTIVAYSAFERDSTGASARLMACAYLDAHAFQDKDWTGRGWFGFRHPNTGLVVDPLVDEDAHAFAESLGFKSRRNGETGTSILIVDCTATDAERLCDGVEEWWWPRLLDEELEVEVETAGKRYFPQPIRQERLLPFIECYSLAVQRSTPVGPHQKFDRFNRLRGLPLGSYGLQVLQPDRAEKLPDERLGCVAMIRSPKMVVEYAQLGRPTPPVVGAFVADPEIDAILKLSEPPTHNRWDPESRRLDMAKPDAQTAREIVRKLRERLKVHVRQFQAIAVPPTPREERRLRFLERLLGAFLQPPRRSESELGGQTGPVEIRFREGPEARSAGEDQLQTAATVALRLRDDAEFDRMRVIVRVRVPVLRDEDGAEDYPIPVTIELDGRSQSVPGTEPEFVTNVSKNEWVVFSIRTVSYERNWSAKVHVEVMPHEGGA